MENKSVSCFGNLILSTSKYDASFPIVKYEVIYQL